MGSIRRHWCPSCNRYFFFFYSYDVTENRKYQLRCELSLMLVPISPYLNGRDTTQMHPPCGGFLCYAPSFYFHFLPMFFLVRCFYDDSLGELKWTGCSVHTINTAPLRHRNLSLWHWMIAVKMASGGARHSFAWYII